MGEHTAHTFPHSHPHVNTHMHLYTHKCAHKYAFTYNKKERERRGKKEKGGRERGSQICRRMNMLCILRYLQKCVSPFFFFLFPPSPPSLTPFFLSPLLKWQIGKSKTRLTHILCIESYSSYILWIISSHPQLLEIPCVGHF